MLLCNQLSELQSEPLQSGRGSPGGRRQVCRGRGPRAGLGVSPEPAGAAPPSRRGLPAPRLPTASGPHRASRRRAPVASQGACESGRTLEPHCGLRVCLSVCLLLPLSEGHLCSPPPFSLPRRDSLRAEGALSRGTAAYGRLPRSPRPSLQLRVFSTDQLPPPPSTPPPPLQFPFPTSTRWPRQARHWSVELGGRGEGVTLGAVT